MQAISRLVNLSKIVKVSGERQNYSMFIQAMQARIFVYSHHFTAKTNADFLQEQ